MIPIRTLRYLRSTAPERLVSSNASWCRRHFSELGVPVLIAARDEEHDLPATLIALADSSKPVLPVVVTNGCTDRTGEFAKALGALVLEGATHKTDSLQLGVTRVLQRTGGRSGATLFTDADTLVGPAWAEVMTAGYTKGQRSEIRFSSLVYAHGDAARVDGARTIYGFAKDASRVIGKKRPVGRGGNMSIYFGADSFYERYMSLPPQLFYGEEEVMADFAEECGGSVTRRLGRSSLVVTRGDRYQTLRELLQLVRAPDASARAERYKVEYGDFTTRGTHDAPGRAEE